MPAEARNHIHLDVDLSGAPENSPTNKYTSLVPDIPIYRALMNIEWAVDGTMMAHKITSAGDTLVSQGHRYRLKVTRTELAALLADLGHQVYFVPHYHPDDGSDHTAYRVQVQFSNMDDIQSREHATLDTYFVTIQIQQS